MNIRLRRRLSAASQRGQIGVPPPNSRKGFRAPPVASLSHRLHDDHGELYARGAGLSLLVHEKSAVLGGGSPDGSGK